MATDLNVCTFTGRLGKDPETKFTTGGDPVCSFSIAVGSSWKNKDGEKQEQTSWPRVVCYKKLAEICGEYLKKGSRVAVSGRFEERKYTDKQGAERRIWELTLEKMTMLDSKADNDRRADQAEPGAREPAQTTRMAGDKRTVDDIDSELPF